MRFKELYNLIKEMNVSIDEDLALPLAVGLLTDTGGFAHKNVLPSTFTMAAELSSLVDLSDIYKKVLRTITINQFNIKNTDSVLISNRIGIMLASQKSLLLTGKMNEFN